MRILHVNNTHRGFGGSDISCTQVIDLCIQRGLNVQVFAKDSKNLPTGLRGKIQAFFSGIYARSAVKEFEEILRTFKPHVVHVHELFPLISPWVLPRCTTAGIPVVMTCYDFRLTCPIATHHNKNGMCYDCMDGKEYKVVFNNCRNSLLESFAYGARNAVASRFELFTKHITRFIVLTEFSKDWIEQHVGIEPGKVAIIPCVVPAPIDVVKDPSEGEYVAYAGRFVPEKGIEILIEACRKIGLPLRLAGDSPSHPAILPGDDVECVSTSAPGALAAFYRGARVFVVASLWEETFSIVLAEAKSHGIPVIAPRIGAIPYVVEDEKTGLLFETGNVDELAKKLQRVWEDDDLCRQLGAAGRRDVQEKFNDDICFEQLLRVYQDVTGISRV